eukprot:GHVU01042472.1.p2 GENE.GHVU01042472.1~~GHVU01042472.1.p2  ORF type:complete len:102 (+),score=1.93 GHVU01042472.1:666-971(+)
MPFASPTANACRVRRPFLLPPPIAAQWPLGLGPVARPREERSGSIRNSRPFIGPQFASVAQHPGIQLVDDFINVDLVLIQVKGEGGREIVRECLKQLLCLV